MNTTTHAALEVKYYGQVRGAGNAYARLHLSISVPEIENPTTTEGREEMKGLFAQWDEMFGMVGEAWVGWDYRINTRREFSIVPVIIRKALGCGYDVKVSQWDEGIHGKVSLKTDPALFWQIVALAQMWFEK